MTCLNLRPNGLYTNDAFIWENRHVYFREHSKMHLDEFHLTPEEIIDMLHEPVPCPQRRRKRRNKKEICSRKNNRTYRIVVGDENCPGYEECWWIINVKPA